MDELLYTQEDIDEWIRTCEELQEKIKEQEEHSESEIIELVEIKNGAMYFSKSSYDWY